MRVVCVDDKWPLEDKCPKLVMGNIYHVTDTIKVNSFRTSSGKLADSGIYYVLFEMGKIPVYHSSLFVEINENQQDETEIAKQREQVLITKQVNYPPTAEPM